MFVPCGGIISTGKELNKNYVASQQHRKGIRYMEEKKITEIVARVVSELSASGMKAGQSEKFSNSGRNAQGSLEGQSGRPQKKETQEVTLKMAVKLIEQIEAEAARMGVNAVIAVANKGGRPVAVHCMDESYIASYDIALNKAYTCAALKMPTSKLKELSQPGRDLYGIQHTNNGQIVIFGGGVPITYGGKVIGGLGVSGGSEAQDTALAEYGEKILKEALDLWQ